MIREKLFLFVPAVMLALASQAVATSRIVSNLNDSGPGSLRQAITELNQHGGGLIQFSNVAGEIALQSPLPDLQASTSIAGPCNQAVTISGGNQFPVFSMLEKTTNHLSGLVIANAAVVRTGSPLPPGGPAIFNRGCLWVENCTIRDCVSGVPGEVHFPVSGDAGAIYNGGTMHLQHSVVTNCEAVFFSFSAGGAILNEGSLTIEDSTIHSCIAGSGGAIWNEGRLAINNSLVADCSAGSENDGGGLRNSGEAVFVSSTISNCAAWWGGGVDNLGILRMTNCTLTANEAGEYGGALELWGTNVLVGCTLYNNQADVAGGAILNGQGLLDLINCTISGNSSDFRAGAIFNENPGPGPEPTARLNHCTVVSNFIARASGAISGGIENGGTVQAVDTIWAFNGAQDFAGNLVSGGYNLIQNTNGCTFGGDTSHNLIGADPLLGPLQDNGGPTLTHALLMGSPAIDQGSSAGLGIDQRGEPRSFDVPLIGNALDGSDIGAVEFTSAHPWLNPVLVGSVNDGGSASGVAMAGHLVYLANGSDGLRVYDISDPANPRTVAHGSYGGRALGLDLRGRELALADGADGLRLLQVREDGTILNVGQSSVRRGCAQAVTLARNDVFVGAGAGGLEVFRNRPNLSVEPILSDPAPGANAVAVAVKDHVVFTGNGANGVWIYEMVPSGRGHLLQKLNTGGEVLGLEVRGNLLFVANGSDGLRIYAIGNGAHPTLLGHIATGGTASGLAIHGSLAYVAAADAGLMIFDVSHPAHPALAAEVGGLGTARAVAVEGRFISVASGQQGLKILHSGGPGPSVHLTRNQDGASLYLAGLAGDRYRVFASSNLQHWELLGSVTNAQGSLQLPDPQSKNSPARFYKIVMP